jgi:hypothetical protein
MQASENTEERRIADYVRGYQEQPEPPEEVALAFAMSRAALANEPWAPLDSPSPPLL